MLQSVFFVTKMYTLPFCIPPTTLTCIALFIQLAYILAEFVSFDQLLARLVATAAFGHWNL